LQQAIRCGQASPTQRDQLFGFIYDLATSRTLALDEVFRAGQGLLTDSEAEDMTMRLARVIHVLRSDARSRADVLQLFADLLSRPDVAQVLPVTIDLLKADVLEELLDAVRTLLSGCGRMPSTNG